MKDLQVRQNVLDELEFEPSIDAAKIGVAVDDGVVTLTGHVSSYFEKLAAEQAARRIKGVRAIAQEIDVAYSGAKKNVDDEIAKQVLTVLKWSVVIPPDAVKVTVQKGLVTLTGEVNWQYQRKAAEDAIRKLSGIVGVLNNISLKPAVCVSDIKRKIEGALARRAHKEADAIKVSIREGNKVLLEGKVDNWDEREAVEDAAWSIAGVQYVDDHLTIGR